MDFHTLQDEVAAAEKSIDEKTAQLVSKGRWMVPGYKVRTLEPETCDSSDPRYRRSSATWLWFNRITHSGSRLRVVYSSIVDTRTRGRTQVFLIPNHLQHFLCASCNLLHYWARSSYVVMGAQGNEGGQCYNMIPITSLRSQVKPGHHMRQLVPMFIHCSLSNP